MNRKHVSLNRRDFLAGMAAAPLAAATASRSTRIGRRSRPVRLGIIGAGSRGTWIGKLFQEHGGYEVVALADYFDDRVNAAGEALGVPAERRFTTLSGFRRLLALADVEAVAIESPPWFHPEQASAAVAAGKHVYLAKPVAVDVPGCLAVEAAGKRASQAGLCFLVDFQTRADADFIEVVDRIHAGDIGTLVFGESTCHLGTLPDLTDPAKSAAENRLRNWVFDQALSGDIIVEQDIHTLDVLNWIVQTPPVRVTGTRGRKVRTNVGDTSDYYTLVFEFDNRLGITFTARQFDGRGTEPEGIWVRLYGTAGEVSAMYGGPILLRGATGYDGDTGPIFRDGAVANIAAFHKTLQEGRTDNLTVAPSVRSNLISIMGRIAAEDGRTVTWEELLNNRDVVDPRLDGLRA